MVEPLAMKPGDAGYGVNGDAETVVTLVRQAVELGADVIKADPTDDVAQYGRVVEAPGGCRCSCGAAGGRRTTRSCAAPRPSSSRAPPGSSTAATSSSTRIRPG